MRLSGLFLCRPFLTTTHALTQHPRPEHMSVPAEAMAATPPAGGAPGGEPSPGAAPTMTPQEPKGEQASADAGMQVAVRMIEHTLAAYLQSGEGAKSPKAKACMHALQILTKAFGKDEEQAQAIMPAELKSALLAPAGEPGPAGAAPMKAAA